MRIPQDYHIHSCFSEDSTSPIEAICQQAVALGIPEIGLSEHWDVGPYEKHPRYFKPRDWYPEIVRVRSLFAGQLTIRAGIEIAEPHLYALSAAGILASCPFDYVIGSVHWMGKDMVFDEQFFSNRTADEVYLAYFTELEKMVMNADLDIVGHFDIPVRTAKPILGYSPSRYQKIIVRILEVMVSRGLAMDVNTAGLRKPAQVLMPDPLILEWYDRAGGKLLTLGSDAHTPDQVGSHLDVALNTIREAGFHHITRFQQRQPVLLKMD